MTSLRAVCVYCGSRKGKDPAYEAAAKALGQALAARGVRLVYGGGGIGLMGVLARTVLDAGGEVTGIIPGFLRDREVEFDAVQDLVVVETMHERKQRMFDEADAFIVLPGGIGTLEETVEMLTWAQLDAHKKPIVLVDVAGYWRPLLALLEHLVERGFAAASVHQLWQVVSGPEEALARIDRLLAERGSPHKATQSPEVL